MRPSEVRAGLFEVLKRKVNVHGELHLDKERTEIYLKWLSQMLQTLSELERFVELVNKQMKKEDGDVV